MWPSDGPETPPGITRVYVMRHGQSTYNAEGRFQGCSDRPQLTAAGIAAAQAAAGYLRGAGLDAVITSPLRRACHTALWIYKRAWRNVSEGPRFALDNQLREIELPLWEGMAVASVRREHAEQYRIWKEQPHLFRMEDRLPVAGLFDRAESFWRGLLKCYAGKTVLAVTHGGAGRALISTALGIPPERFHAIQQSNAAISLLEFPSHTEVRARLLAANATDYLGERLPKLKESKTGVRILLLPAGAAASSQVSHIEQILQNTRIHAAFGDCAASREIASRLVSGHEIRAGVAPELPAAGGPPDSLTTLLWVVEERLFLRRVAEALGVPRNGGGRLSAVPYTLTVLHYPGPGKAPILQAMNLHDTGRLARSTEPIPAGGGSVTR
jgi:broad specificity phosphatase PhoE